MEKRCIPLPRTKEQNEQRIIEAMHGNSIPFPFIPHNVCGSAGETEGISPFNEMKQSHSQSHKITEC